MPDYVLIRIHPDLAEPFRHMLEREAARGPLAMSAWRDAGLGPVLFIEPGDLPLREKKTDG